MAQKVVIICSITALTSIQYKVELHYIRLCRDEKKKKRPLLSKGMYNSSLRQEIPITDEMKKQMGNVLKQYGIIGWQDGQWNQHSVTLSFPEGFLIDTMINFPFVL